MTRQQDDSTPQGVTLDRRTWLQTLAGAAAAATLPWDTLAGAAELKGRIHQSVCLWCYNGYMKKENSDPGRFCGRVCQTGAEVDRADRARRVADAEETRPDSAMVPSHGIGKGLNRVENHEECLAAVRKGIDQAADAGFPNVITFSGNREGMDDQEGLKNCVAGLKKIAGYAEEKKITICLEYLNSINHKDYMADTTKWCVQLVQQVGSPRVKVLYDIYHAGMMKEDVLADIKNHHECWGHYHTGGLPGRNEIDETQTLDYAQLMRAIVESGYQAYVGQEFIPKRPDALASLEQAVRICDV